MWHPFTQRSDSSPDRGRLYDVDGSRVRCGAAPVAKKPTVPPPDPDQPSGPSPTDPEGPTDPKPTDPTDPTGPDEPPALAYRPAMAAVR
ncbi:MAG TPA: hypothetical protein VGP31_10050 [Planosporangium sp.]|nr:hypothetical protein [Planosporangium sp.]